MISLQFLFVFASEHSGRTFIWLSLYTPVPDSGMLKLPFELVILTVPRLGPILPPNYPAMRPESRTHKWDPSCADCKRGPVKYGTRLHRSRVEG